MYLLFHSISTNYTTLKIEKKIIWSSGLQTFKFPLILYVVKFKISRFLSFLFIQLTINSSLLLFKGQSRSWSFGSWIYNYLCNQCLSPLTLWVWIPLRRGVLDTTLCDKVCQCLTTVWWFSPGTPVSSTNKTNCHDITEILLKVALNTINQTTTTYFSVLLHYYLPVVAVV
jgi:hypothetical protein